MEEGNLANVSDVPTSKVGSQFCGGLSIFWVRRMGRIRLSIIERMGSV
jgi:hypothetical protein